MTEMVYDAPLTSFDTGVVPTNGDTVPVSTEGRIALEKVRVVGSGYISFIHAS